MVEVVPKRQRRNLVQGCLNRPNLLDDIDAVRVLFDHSRDTANVALDALQSSHGRGAVTTRL